MQKHICICAPWKGTCRQIVVEWIVRYWREEGTKSSLIVMLSHLQALNVLMMQ